MNVTTLYTSIELIIIITTMGIMYYVGRRVCVCLRAFCAYVRACVYAYKCVYNEGVTSWFAFINMALADTQRFVLATMFVEFFIIYLFFNTLYYTIMAADGQSKRDGPRFDYYYRININNIKTRCHVFSIDKNVDC